MMHMLSWMNPTTQPSTGLRAPEAPGMSYVVHAEAEAEVGDIMPQLLMLSRNELFLE